MGRGGSRAEMIGIIRSVFFGFMGLSVVYWLVRVYSRSVRRERLEREFDAGGVSGARDEYIKLGMDHYEHGLRKRLILLVYIIPAIIVGMLYPLLRRVGVPPFARGAILGSAAAGAAVALNFLVLLAGGKDDWDTLARLVLLAHVPVVLVEGLLLGVVVRYLEKVKPEMLY